MNKRLNKFFQVFICFCVFSVLILGVAFVNTKTIVSYANIENWNIGETSTFQNERPKFGQNIIVEYCANTSTSEINYTTIQPKSVGEYLDRFTVEETINNLKLDYKTILVASESVDSGHIESRTNSTSRSPKDTPKGLSAFAILGIVTLSVCAVFGIGIGIYHLVEKIKKDRKENKNKVK